MNVQSNNNAPASGGSLFGNLDVKPGGASEPTPPEVKPEEPKKPKDAWEMA